MSDEIIELGRTKFNIEETWYKKFCNKYEKEETTKESRNVFQYDWQRFVWAFILGIAAEQKTPLTEKTKNPPFGQEVFNKKSKILKTMIALVLQEEYKENPDKLKEDFEKACEKGENLGKQIKTAIEEYANTGFSILDMRTKDKPGYIENLEYAIDDILGDRIW